MCDERVPAPDYNQPKNDTAYPLAAEGTEIWGREGGTCSSDLARLDIHHSRVAQMHHRVHVEPGTKRDGTAFPSRDRGACERELLPSFVIAVIRELVHELHPQRAKIMHVSASSRLERDLGIDSLGWTELILRIERSFRVRHHHARVDHVRRAPDGERCGINNFREIRRIKKILALISARRICHVGAPRMAGKFSGEFIPQAARNRIRL